MNEALKVKNLSKEYKDFKLNNLTFSLPKGTITGLIGENGSGKTTLIKSILALTHPKADEILFWDHELKESNSWLKEKIGVVFDNINFNESLNPKQIEKICKVSYKNWDSNLYNELLNRYNLPFNKISTFSKGMKMKLQCAVALAHKPKLLILDEVTAGLDTIAKEDLVDILFNYIQDEENTVLISSHDINEIERISDYILFISRGSQVFFKSKEEIIEQFKIVKCSKEDFRKLDKTNVVSIIENDYSIEAILKKSSGIRNEQNFKLEDFLRIFLRGNNYEKFDT